jgi:hypothetical protein
MTDGKPDVRLTKVSTICLELPGTERRNYHDHADFRVRGKAFAYFLNNHHADGIPSAARPHSAKTSIAPRASRTPFICRPTLALGAGSVCGCSAGPSIGRK